MAQYKGTLFFHWEDFGWTESYFAVNSATGAAQSNILTIATARMALSRPDVICDRGIISDIAIRGDAIEIPGFPIVGTNADAGTTQIPDIALLMKWKVGVYNRNKTFLRGYPLMEGPAGGYTPSLGYPALVTAYVDAVKVNAVMKEPTGDNPTPPPKLLYVFAPVLAGTITQLVHRRKTGRPFGQPRGRRVAP